MQTKLRTLTLALLISVFCSAAIASETFLVSSTDGRNIILQMYKLDQNLILLVNSKVIPVNNWIWGLFNTAILYRNINNNRFFDVYFGTCLDMECVEVTLSMKRLDLNLNVLFEKDDIIPRDYWLTISGLSTVRLQQKNNISFRLFMGAGDFFSERILDLNGNPDAPNNVAFEGKYLDATSADDGRMVVAESGDTLQIRPFHPAGEVTKVRTPHHLYSLSLSDPITSKKIAKPYRLLLYRINYGPIEAPTTTIMMQKLDNATGKFLGGPRTFVGNSRIPYFYSVQNHKSIAVTPAGNVIFYTTHDMTCKRELVWGQVFNPETLKKVGDPQLLIGCNTLSLGGANIQGLDVVRLEF